MSAYLEAGDISEIASSVLLAVIGIQIMFIIRCLQELVDYYIVYFKIVNLMYFRFGRTRPANDRRACPINLGNGAL